MSCSAEAQPTTRSRVDRRIERRQRQVVMASFAIARRHVRKGYSPRMAMTHVALPAGEIQRRLRHRGIHASENTIRADLGDPVDRFASSADGQPAYKRASLYDLVTMSTRFGRLGERLLSDLVLLAYGRTDSALSSSSSPRARGYLEWATENAHEGVRSAIGNRLAWACASKFGLSLPETVKVMSEYQAIVPQPAGKPYTPREAMATVRSVYRRTCPSP